MLIFLEGPDGAGKSTLATEMSKQMNFEVVHFSYPKNQYEKDTMFEMYSDFIHENNNVIVDRCWYSDMVYSIPVRHEKSPITIDKMHELERLVISQGGGMIIHCSDKIARLWERFKARGDDYIVEDFQLLETIRKGYEDLFHTKPHLLPVFRYGISKSMPKS